MVEDSGEIAPVDTSLVGIRVAAAIGAVIALVAVAIGFSFGLVYGIVALVAVPAVPLLFVLAFEAMSDTSS